MIYKSKTSRIDKKEEKKYSFYYHPSYAYIHQAKHFYATYVI